MAVLFAAFSCVHLFSGSTMHILHTSLGIQQSKGEFSAFFFFACFVKIFKGWNDIFYPKKEDRKTICLNGYKRWMQAKQNKDEFHGNQMVRGIFADCWRQKGPKTKRWTNEIENSLRHKRTSWRRPENVIFDRIVVIFFAFVTPRSYFRENHVCCGRIGHW